MHSRDLRGVWTAVLLAVGTMLVGSHARAAGNPIGTVELDPHHTVVAFHLDATLHDVHGTFALRSGTLSVDPTTGAASGTILVDATSGESGNTSRDVRLVGEVLDGARFPTIRFRAERVEGHPDSAGTFHATLYGVLTLRGDDHEVAVTVDGRRAGDTLIARARFTVPYVAWGLPDPSLLFLTVAKTVDIDVATESPITWTGDR